MNGFSPVRPQQNPAIDTDIELFFIHEFAGNCYEFLSAASREAMTAPRLAPSTTGARCRYFAWAASVSSGVPANKSPRWNLMVKSGSLSKWPVRIRTTDSPGLTKPLWRSFLSPARVTAEAGDRKSVVEGK